MGMVGCDLYWFGNLEKDDGKGWSIPGNNGRGRGWEVNELGRERSGERKGLGGGSWDEFISYSVALF